ncbi:MAG: aminotransferase class V-fold PLP-dependent enzyme [Candidatus Dormibacteraeota bacterium]|nr:aminotransferase class V-fold PLP-dependent enzyme [Candidatus Dormibacteraeota bacterium]
MPVRPTLCGAGVPAPLLTGGERPYVNLDYAASTPALCAVAQAVERMLPYYSSVHRGAGFKSQVSTAAYESARERLLSFFGAREGDVAVFTRNTTDSMNLLASAMHPGSSVVTFCSEHHADLLPWRREGLRAVCLPIPESPQAGISALSAELDRGEPVDLVAVTGASNVTGELWPLAELVEVAHHFGARVLVDAAQIAPHLPINLAHLGADYLAASGHKMYAPYGAGILIGRPDWLSRREPFLRGGGAVDFVTRDSVQWSELPARQEAGSPNVLGAVAMAVAAAELERYGMERVWAEESDLGASLRSGLLAIPGVRVYAIWPEATERTGVVSFNLEGQEHSLLAAALSAEYGIGVRHGCFCAHPLMLHLLSVPEKGAEDIRSRLAQGDHSAVPGAVRASLGLGTTRLEVEYFLSAVAELAARGPRLDYEVDPRTGDYVPTLQPTWALERARGLVLAGEAAG